MNLLLFDCDLIDMRPREPRRKMRRFYTLAEFTAAVEKLQDADADVKITADVKMRVEKRGTFLQPKKKP